MQRTNISYLDFTWNPGCGCPRPIPSAGCTNCWARGLHDKRHRAYLAGKKLPAQYAKPFHELQMFADRLEEPLHRRLPAKIGVQFMGDLFAFPFEWIDRIFAVMALCRQHQFMCLTKRAGRMREYIKYYCQKEATGIPLPNVHHGVTVENDENLCRLDYLVETPIAYRFVSFEPLLHETHPRHTVLKQIDYAFIGCGSGHEEEKRLCTLDDIRYLMSRCRAAKVKIHIKQIPLKGKCNKKFAEWPKEFQIR